MYDCLLPLWYPVAPFLTTLGSRGVKGTVLIDQSINEFPCLMLLSVKLIVYGMVIFRVNQTALSLGFIVVTLYAYMDRYSSVMFCLLIYFGC